MLLRNKTSQRIIMLGISYLATKESQGELNVLVMTL